MQFVHTFLSAFGSRLKYRSDGSGDRAGLLRAQQQQRQDHRGRMGGHTRPGLQIQGQNLCTLALHPGRTHAGAGFVFERAGKINDGAACVTRSLPVLAGAFGVGGEERKVHVLEQFGADALNESDFVAHRLQLAEGFVVIEQTDVNRWKVAVVQHFGNFFATQRCGAHNRSPVKGAATARGVGRQNGFWRSAHFFRMGHLRGALTSCSVMKSARPRGKEVSGECSCVGTSTAVARTLRRTCRTMPERKVPGPSTQKSGRSAPQ